MRAAERMYVKQNPVPSTSRQQETRQKNDHQPDKRRNVVKNTSEEPEKKRNRTEPADVTNGHQQLQKNTDCCKKMQILETALINDLLEKTRKLENKEEELMAIQTLLKNVQEENEKLKKDLVNANNHIEKSDIGNSRKEEKLTEIETLLENSKKENKKLQQDLANANTNIGKWEEYLANVNTIFENSKRTAARDKYLEMCLQEVRNQHLAAHNIYELLKVDRKSPLDVKRTEYRKTARKYHPDKFHNHPISAQLTSHITVAFEIMSVERKDEAYNRYMDFGLNSFEAMKATQDGAPSQLKSSADATELIDFINTARNYLQIIKYSPSTHYGIYSKTLKEYVDHIAWNNGNKIERKLALDRLQRLKHLLENKNEFLKYVEYLKQQKGHHEALRLLDAE